MNIIANSEYFLNVYKVENLLLDNYDNMREDLAMLISTTLVSAIYYNNEFNSYTWVVEQAIAVISLSGERLPDGINKLLIANPINTIIIEED
ncbi:hypothetical protein RND61_14975 [Streptomyces sp. TRM76323]|uniref:Uncharacterized protein n=1 Tax=Streptomyces tamarix TaxID=3078565 RepID=A0ABU3QL55_9ACTN|nr:hypothetical protein [Streptomyces tamarix]MDT9683366.1 hypothetical protein [Streptomyces tamarix]